jgi:hypothetical protein
MKAILLIALCLSLASYAAAYRYQCPPLRCAIYCEQGLAIDHVTGCALCKCAESDFRLAEDVAPFIVKKPVFPRIPNFSKCPKMMCALYCKNGFATNPKTGCRMCRCKTNRTELPVRRPVTRSLPAPSPKCKPLTCALYCPNDNFAVGPDGCPKCSCRKPETREYTESSDIISRKYRQPEDKCPKEYMCALYCPNGMEVDSAGCSLCKCKAATNLLMDSVMIPNIRRCPGLLCRPCRNGFELDPITKCPTCKCSQGHNGL